MNIKLYQNKDPANKVSKTLPEPTLNLSGTLREGTSILSPVIMIKADTTILNCNYAHIEEFKRYYFITDIESVTDELWRITLAVDVLTSFSTYIYSQTGFVERNQTNANYSIEDKKLDLLLNEKIKEWTCSSYLIKRSGATVDKWDYSSNTNYYNYNILVVPSAIASVKLDSGSYYKWSSPSLNQPVPCLHYINSAFSPDTMSVPILSSEVQSTGIISDAIKKSFSPSSIFLYPFAPDISTYTTGGKTYNAIDRLTSYSGNVTYDVDSTIILNLRHAKTRWYCLADFDMPSTYDSIYTWMEYKRKIQLYIPYISWIDLDPKDVTGKNVRIYCLPSLTTGEGFFYVTAGSDSGTDHRVIWSGRSIIAQSIPMDSDNSKELTNRWINFGISTAISAITTSALMAIDPTKIGAYALMSSTGGLVTKATSMSINTNPTSTSQIQTANQGMVSPFEPILRITYPQIAHPNSANYASLFGLPDYETTTLSELTGTGYSIVKHIQWSGESYITKTEQEALNQKLSSGVIL